MLHYFMYASLIVVHFIVAYRRLQRRQQGGAPGQSLRAIVCIILIVPWLTHPCIIKTISSPMRTTTTRTKSFMFLLLPCSWKFKECVKNVHRRRESLIRTWSCTYQTVMQFHVLVCVYFPKHSFDVDRGPYVHLENKSWILCDDSATKLRSDGQISEVRWLKRYMHE